MVGRFVRGQSNETNPSLPGYEVNAAECSLPPVEWEWVMCIRGGLFAYASALFVYVSDVYIFILIYIYTMILNLGLQFLKCCIAFLCM